MEQEFDLGSTIGKNILPIVLGGAGILLIGSGVFATLSQKENSSKMQFQSGNRNNASSSAKSSESQDGTIVVDIEGAVISPGIYKIPLGSRLHDILVASGGLSAQADRDWTAKNINQAAKLSDGQKIYIPRGGESILNAASTDSASNSDISSLIDINSASLKDLDSLPGVGPVTAQKIVDGRSYVRKEELLEKKIVSSPVFQKIKDKITAN